MQENEDRTALRMMLLAAQTHREVSEKFEREGARPVDMLIVAAMIVASLVDEHLTAEVLTQRVLTGAHLIAMMPAKPVARA